MAQTYVIADNKTSSAIYAGYADAAYKRSFTEPFKNVVTSVKKLTTKLIDKTKEFVGQVKKGLKFFADWWKDDPIGATAGALAVGLSVGVVVVVGGQLAGAITGGIAALRTLRLVSLIKAGLKIAFASVAVGALIRWMIRGVQYLWNFNWNISDTDIRKQQEGAINQLYGLAGNVVGTSLATVLCGVAPIEISKRTGLVRVNPMTLALMRELTEFNPHSDDYGEIYEEMMEAMKALVNAGSRAASQVIFLESYKNIRKWIKNGYKIFGLSVIFPQFQKTLDAWGKEGSQAWSFASATENWIESISDQRIQNFTEEAIESFMDTCTENAMVISYTL